VRFARLQEVTAASCYTEHVSQGSGQFLRQESQVLQARLLLVEDLRGLLQEFGRSPELHRFDVVCQAGHVAVPVVGAQVAGLAFWTRPREEP
jgi:hypothetical protein